MHEVSRFIFYLILKVTLCEIILNTKWVRWLKKAKQKCRQTSNITKCTFKKHCSGYVDRKTHIKSLPFPVWSFHTCPIWVCSPSQRGPSSCSSALCCLCFPARSRRRCDCGLYCTDGVGSQRPSRWPGGPRDADRGCGLTGTSCSLWC